jgi:hypothetical protein
MVDFQLPIADLEPTRGSEIENRQSQWPDDPMNK